MSCDIKFTTPKGNTITFVKDYTKPIYRASAVDIMKNELVYPKDKDPKWKAKATIHSAKSSEINLFWLLALLINGGNERNAEDLLLNKRDQFFRKEIIKMYMAAKERSQGAAYIQQLVEEEKSFFYEIAKLRTGGNLATANDLMETPKTFFRDDKIINLYCYTQKIFKKTK
jgi:hypothetical protein